MIVKNFGHTGLVAVIIATFGHLAFATEREAVYEGNCSIPDCVKCNASGRCVRCLNAILHPTGECVTECAGRVEWSYEDALYEGVVCYEKAHRTYSLNDLLLVVAACCCGAVCVAVVLATIWYSRCRRKKNLDSKETKETKKAAKFASIEEKKKKKEKEQKAHRKKGSEWERICDTPESEPQQRQAFFKRLEALHPETPYFLEMLNETRKLGRLYPENDVQSKAYRAAIRDLLRILTLLSRKDEVMTIPHDWQRLLGWAERVLHRYKRWKTTRGNSPTPFRRERAYSSEPPPPYEAAVEDDDDVTSGCIGVGISTIRLHDQHLDKIDEEDDDVIAEVTIL